MFSLAHRELGHAALHMSEENTSTMLAYARSRQEEYRCNAPFPHIVVDNLFPVELLRDVVKEIVGLEKFDREKMFYGAEKKFTTNDIWRMGPTTRDFLFALNSSPFCEFIETLTGYDGIISDPHMEGGGVHEIRNGGFLKIHSDFNWNKKLRLDRRVNLLLYLNENWAEEWGGKLEFWNRDMKERAIDVAPLFNRMVIFSTNDISFHGHPEPIMCPDGESRKSLALYYYTNGRDGDAVGSRETDTNYKERPEENFGLDSRKVNFLVKKMCPPIVIELIKRWRR